MPVPPVAAGKLNVYVEPLQIVMPVGLACERVVTVTSAELEVIVQPEAEQVACRRYSVLTVNAVVV